MNADRMISVFLAGVLVGGTVVYLAPNNGLSVGIQSFGENRGGPSGANGGAASTEAGVEGAPPVPAGDKGASTGAAGVEAAAGAGGVVAGGAEGGAASGGASAGGEAPGAAGAGPGAQGAQTDGGMQGGGGQMGGGGGGQMGESTMGSTGLAGGGMGGGGQMGASGGTAPSMGASPATGAPKGATRLMRHLQLAPSLWQGQAAMASASSDPAVHALAKSIAEHAASVPEVGDRLPPNTEILPYLLDSKLLLERMTLAGMEVSTLQSQVDEVSKSKR